MPARDSYVSFMRRGLEPPRHFTVPRSTTGARPLGSGAFLCSDKGMDDFDAIDDDIHTALSNASVIAVVGASANPARPSHYVAQFLQSVGKQVIAVNPGLAGQEMFGGPVYGSLADIPADLGVQMVDIFRRAEAVPEIAREAQAHLPKLQVIWMQLGIRHPEVAQEARANGLIVVQNRCPKIEYPRLFGA